MRRIASPWRASVPGFESLSLRGIRGGVAEPGNAAGRKPAARTARPGVRIPPPPLEIAEWRVAPTGVAARFEAGSSAKAPGFESSALRKVVVVVPVRTWDRALRGRRALMVTVSRVAATVFV